MSMPKIEKSDNPIDRNQSVSNLIESVALMETGLSHIINAEGEKIQKVIKSDDPTADVPIEDILQVNNSVERMVNTVAKLEMILQNKLDISKDLDQGEQPITETAGGVIPYSGTININTSLDGSPDRGAIVGFDGADDTRDLNLEGNVDSIVLPLSYVSYPVPRNVVLTDFSAFVDVIVATGAGIEKKIMARIFTAEPNSTTYTAVTDATINFPPIPADVADDYRMSASVNNLNVEIAANTKILLLFYCSNDDIGITSVRAVVGASINIR